jgi:hypothetical protein
MHYITQPRPRGGRGFDGELKLTFSGTLTNQTIRISVCFSPGAVVPERVNATVGLMRL